MSVQEKDPVDFNDLKKSHMSEKTSMNKEDITEQLPVKLLCLQICGFPLHFAYKDMDSIVESVKATGGVA